MKELAVKIVDVRERDEHGACGILGCQLIPERLCYKYEASKVAVRSAKAGIG